MGFNCNVNHALKVNLPDDFIYKWTPRILITRTDNRVLIHIIKIWYEICKSLRLEASLSPKTPLRQNELIPMTLDYRILKMWHQKRIHYLKDCYDNGFLMSFEQLKGQYDLSSNNFFCYLQLRPFFTTTLGLRMTFPLLSDVKKLLHEENVPRLISKMYIFYWWM